MKLQVMRKKLRRLRALRALRAKLLAVAPPQVRAAYYLAEALRSAASKKDKK